MSDIDPNDIRLTYKQRTWVMAYLLVDTPHSQDDKFCRLLMDFLAQPTRNDADMEIWDRLLPDKGVKG